MQKHTKARKKAQYGDNVVTYCTALILAENSLVSLDNVFNFIDKTGFLNKL